MPKNILIYSPGSLGDTLMICPALRFIRSRHANDKMSLLFDSPEGRSKLKPSEILEETDLIDSFVEYLVPRSDQILRTFLAIMRLFWSLLGKFDTVYYLVECWEGDSRAQRDRMFFRLCGISDLKHFDRLQLRPNVDSVADSRAIEALYRAGDDFALEYQRSIMSYEYFCGSCDRSKKPCLADSHYVLAPFSNMQTKDWPVDRYVSIAKWLKEKFFVTPIIFGSQDDAERATDMISRIGSGETYCGQLHFRDTKRKIRDQAFYLGNDSGLMHLSAAVGLPCFSIFSARDFRGRWLPLGPAHVNLRRFDIECEGCQSSLCHGPIYNKCLNSISVEFCRQRLEVFVRRVSCDFS